MSKSVFKRYGGWGLVLAGGIIWLNVFSNNSALFSNSLIDSVVGLGLIGIGSYLNFKNR